MEAPLNSQIVTTPPDDELESLFELFGVLYEIDKEQQVEIK